MVRIRKYKPRDRASLIELWQRVFPDDPPHNNPEKVIEQKLAVDDLIFTAVEDEQIIGACLAGYDGHRGWLYAVAVSKSHRRQGVGAQLIETAKAALAASGCNKLNIQIRATNAKAAQFYAALGFKVERRISMGVLLV